MRANATSVRLAGNESGATIVEFAFVLPVLCVLLLGIFDLGYKSYASSVMQGALHDAARMATVGNVTMDQINARVRERLGTFAGPQATITTATESTYDFESVRRAERLLIDTAPVGSYNQGDCWEEVTGNTQHDTNRGRNGQGGADDIVRYEVTMTYPRIVPIHRLLGWSANETITASTVLRNQPYAGRALNVQRLQWRLEGTPAAWTLGTC